MEDIENYEVLSIIGTGSFGTCYRVKNKINSEEFVWKAVEYGKMSEEKKQLLVSEVNLLSKLKHPHIVQYYNHIIHKKSFTLYIIMEYCRGGDLARVVRACRDSERHLEESFVWRVLYQLASALDLCHNQCAGAVLHRDVKPANVFLDARLNVKLGDFGLAKVLLDRDQLASTLVGTPLYMSPELARSCRYSAKCDVWALGCLVHELAALSAPFAAPPSPRHPIPAFYTDELQNMIDIMLDAEAAARPSVSTILRHPTVLARSSHPVKSLYRKPTPAGAEAKGSHLNARLENIRSKEAALKAREERLAAKERALAKREKKLAVMERLVGEKLVRAELYLKQARGRGRSRAGARQALADLDESLSADPGDTSVLATSGKISEELVPKPKPFQRSYSERRVHFHKQRVFESAPDQPVLTEYVLDDGAQKKGQGLGSLWAAGAKMSQSSGSSLGSKSSCSATELHGDVAKVWTKENKKFAFTLLKTLNADSNKENVSNKACHTQL